MIKLHNFFDIFSVTEGEEEKHIGHAENVVCNYTYDYLAQISPVGKMFQYTAMGTGVGVVPAITDVNLKTWALSRSNSVVDRQVDVKGTSFVKFMIELLPTEYNGTLFTEVGLTNSASSSSSSYKLFTHAIITDNQGKPITIEKKSNERLLVYATVYATIDYTLADPFSKPIGEYLGNQWQSMKYDQCEPTGSHTLRRILRYVPGDPRGYQTKMYLQETMRNIAGLPYVACDSYNDYAIPFAELRIDYTKNTYTGNTRNFATLINSNVFNGRNLYGATCKWEGVDMACSRIKDVPVTGAQLGNGDGVTKRFKVPHDGIKSIDVYVNGIKTPVTLKYNKFREHNVLIWPTAVAEALKVVSSVGYNNEATPDWCFPIRYKSGYLWTFYWQEDTTRQHYIHLRENNGIAEFVILDDADVDFPEELQSGFYEFTLASNNTLLFVNKVDYNGSNLDGCSIYEYDVTTGTIGTKLYESPIYNILPEISGTKGIIAREKVGTTYNTQCVNIVRKSASVIELERYGTPLDTGAAAHKPFPLGTNAITDRLCAVGQENNIVDWENGVIKRQPTTTESSVYLGIETAIKFTKWGTNGTIQIGNIQSDNTIIWQDTVFNLNNVDEFDGRPYVIQPTKDSIMLCFKTRYGGSSSNGYFHCKKYKKDVNGIWYEPRIKYTQLIKQNIWTTYRGGISQILTVAGIDISMQIPCISSGVNKDQMQEYYETAIYMPTEHVPTDGYIEFAVAPASGTAITGNYLLDYLPKSDAWTLGINSDVTYARGAE